MSIKYPKSDEQKLVDICFEIGLTIKGNEALKSMSNEGLANWIAEQLRGCGFDTIPMGSSCGMLKKNKGVPDEESDIENKRQGGYGWQEHDDGSEPPGDNNIFRN